MGPRTAAAVVNGRIERWFPDLRRTGYRVASLASAEYNCVAWAAENDEAWWWPDPWFQAYWPVDVPRQCSIEAFGQMFELMGYEECEVWSVESGFEKIAIYVDRLGRPTHAARQLPDGAWTSKLGPEEDIQHATLEGLTGATYGTIGLIMKRRVSQE